MHVHGLVNQSVLTALAMSTVIGVASEPATAEDVVYVPGIVRDFLPTHGDFGSIRPDLGMGHYAGNLALTLGEDHRPVFSGAGFKVRDQWRDKYGRPIPPHLAIRHSAIFLANSPVVSGGAVVDTWNSSLGPYGGSNVGPMPPVIVEELDPPPDAPTGLGPSVGDRTYTGNGTTTLASNLHCNTLEIADGRTLRIDGNIVILCDGNFLMHDDATIELHDSNDSLDLYVTGSVQIQDSVINGNDESYRNFTLYVLGSGDIRLADGAQVFAQIVAPEASLAMPDSADFYGTLTVGSATLTDAAGVHIDTGGRVCGDSIVDVAGLSSGASHGGISSADSFGQWYRDVPYVNLSDYHILELRRNEVGEFEYLDDSFFPIDDELLGNDSDHNRYFTYTFELEFVYNACDGYFLEFQGNDDAWVFVDDQLAMDLGGVGAITEQYVDFDRLDLEDGQTYTLSFFYAHRGSIYPSFHLRTNLPLETTRVILPVSVGFD
jgi:fibro-slime domain-containing protein